MPGEAGARSIAARSAASAAASRAKSPSDAESCSIRWLTSGGEDLPGLVLVAWPVGDLAAVHDRIEPGVAIGNPAPACLPELLAQAGPDHVPGEKNNIERLVVHGLHALFAQEAYEPEEIGDRPVDLPFNQVANFEPSLQEPPAAVGGLFEPVEKDGRLIDPGGWRGVVACVLDGPGVVEELAAKLKGLLELPGAGLARAQICLANAVGQVGRLQPVGPLDHPGQPRGLRDQLGLGGSLRLHVLNELVDPILKPGRIFLRQDGDDRRGQDGLLQRVDKDPEPALGTSGSELSRERHGCSLLVEFGPGEHSEGNHEIFGR